MLFLGKILAHSKSGKTKNGCWLSLPEAIKRLTCGGRGQWRDLLAPFPPAPGFSVKDLGILPLLLPEVSLRLPPMHQKPGPQQHPSTSHPQADTNDQQEISSNDQDISRVVN